MAMINVHSVKGLDQYKETSAKFVTTLKDMLATLKYQIRKDKKADILVDLKEVMVISPMEEQEESPNKENVSSG